MHSNNGFDGGLPPPRTGTVAAVVRNLLVVGIVATVAVLVSGFLRGDPAITSLVPGFAPPTHGPATAAPGHASGQAAPKAARAPDTPPPGYEEADHPLGTPAKPAVASDSYKFLATNDDGTPVGYSPCRPLHYVVNAAQAPAGSEGLISDAIAKIAAATGLSFIDDGTTEENPSEKRDPYQPDLYGDRWAPLLISWTTPEAAPALAGSVIGTGGSTMYSFTTGPKSYVTGSLDLDAPQITELLGIPGGSHYVSAVIQHELGHVVGLDHVQDPVQLMYPEIGAPDGLAAGDLNGLYKLASAPCRKDL
ncbi:matrixin family metalloprotease [Arthrobacter sp. NyZ413]|uniref:matrixin family metalloprotease n=1 Tax=Arthrobacter sp. NyZ413 TaxID=3144669 RepID=UPI003BF8BFA3